MNPDSSIGRIMTIEDAMLFWTRVAEAEKVMGKLSREEKMVILNNFGKDVSKQTFDEMLKTKKMIQIKHKEL